MDSDVQSVRERTGLDRGPEVLQQAMALLRARFIDLLAELSEAEWETMDDQGALCLTGTASYPTIGMLAGLTGDAFPSRLRP